MNDLWNKPVNELSVKDSLKIQAEIAAAMLAVGAAIIGASMAVERVQTWRRNRKNTKKTEN